MKTITIILLLVFSFNAFATKYYVSSSGGSDSNSGLTESLAWATISKVNGATFNEGDSVLFKKGDTWREMLTVARNGASGAYMYFGAYGAGDNPRILGSKTTTWSDQGSNIWKSDVTFTNPNTLNAYDSGVGVTWFQNTDGSVSWGTRETSTGNLTAEYEWCWVSDYMYVYAASDPDTRYTAVEVPQRNFIFDLNYMDYVHIKDIDMLYCGYAAIQFDAGDGGWQSKTGLIIDGCEIGYVAIKNSEAGYGTQAIYNDMIVRNCDVHDCGRRSLSLHLYGSYTIRNILIEDNYFHDGWHTTGVDMSVGQGSGIHLNGIVIRRNKFYDPPTSSAYAHHIFMQNYDYGDLSSTLRNVYVYSNLFYYPTGASINMEGTQSAFIYNNTFYGNNNGGSDAQIWIDANNDSITIKNNIFYTEYGTDSPGVQVFIRAYGRDLTHHWIDYNCYYRTSNSLRLFENESVQSYYMNTLANLRSDLGFETHGMFSDPLFNSDPTDLTLTEDSPPKSTGVDLDIVLDYAGNAWNETPSIGAYEYGSSAPVLVTSITISAAGSATTIETDGGTLQMYTNVEPDNASDTTKTWSVIDGTGSATIAQTGIVTAVSDGTVTVRATANDASGVFDDYVLTLSNQDEPPPDPEPESSATIKENGKFIKENGKFIKP